MTSNPLPLVIYGLGPIGQAAAVQALADPGYRPVAAVDIRPELVGRDLGEVIDRQACGVRVAATLSEALDSAAVPPRAAVHATGSRIERVAGQFQELIEAELAVATSCEEMLFPWRVAPELAEELDRAARDRGVCLYGAGVNPGFVIDRMPAALLKICTELRSVHVRRVVDTLTRRPQLRAKTGAGKTVEEFQGEISQGLGHVGLPESLEFLARAAGRAILRQERRLEPVVARAPVDTPEGRIPSGGVLGAREEVDATLDGEATVRLELIMAAGSGPMTDTIEIDAVPPLKVEFEGGVAGKEATASALVVGARTACSLPPGIARV